MYLTSGTLEPDGDFGGGAAKRDQPAAVVIRILRNLSGAERARTGEKQDNGAMRAEPHKAIGSPPSLFRSASTIMCTSPWKSTVGVHASSRRAFEASPIS